MRTLLLRSVIFALLTIPFIAARDPNPVRGLKKGMARLTLKGGDSPEISVE